jgi:hypothetical protein
LKRYRGRVGIRVRFGVRVKVRVRVYIMRVNSSSVVASSYNTSFLSFIFEVISSLLGLGLGVRG